MDQLVWIVVDEQNKLLGLFGHEAHALQSISISYERVTCTIEKEKLAFDYYRVTVKISTQEEHIYFVKTEPVRTTADAL